MVNNKAWRRLQEMNTRLNQKTYSKRWSGRGKKRRSQITVLSAVSDTCEILGSGDDEKIKGRLLWFADYYPNIYKQVVQEVV